MATRSPSTRRTPSSGTKTSATRSAAGKSSAAKVGARAKSKTSSSKSVNASRSSEGRVGAGRDREEIVTSWDDDENESPRTTSRRPSRAANLSAQSKRSSASKTRRQPQASTR